MSGSMVPVPKGCEKDREVANGFRCYVGRLFATSFTSQSTTG